MSSLMAHSRGRAGTGHPLPSTPAVVLTPLLSLLGSENQLSSRELLKEKSQIKRQMSFSF